MNQLFIALVIALAGFGSGWQVRAWKAGSDQTNEVKAEVKEVSRQAAQVDVAAAGHEKFKEVAAARERIVIKEVDRVIEKSVYLNSCFDVDGLRIIATDIATRKPASQPTTAMQATPEP